MSRFTRIACLCGFALAFCGCAATSSPEYPAAQDGYQLEVANGSRLRGEAANAVPDWGPLPPFAFRREAQGVAECAQSEGFESAPEGGLMRRLRALAGEDPEPRDESQTFGP